MRHFLRDDDITALERSQILDLALQMKQDRFGWRPLEGPKSVALLFDKPSTRTRVSFSVAVNELGGNAVVLENKSTQVGRGETPQDTARSISRQVSAIVWRTFHQSDLDAVAARSVVPVVNSLSDAFHPCQLLADCLTIREHFGAVTGTTLAFVGDIANNMAHSYLLAGASSGMHIRLAGPKHLVPRPDVVEVAEKLAADSGGSVSIGSDPIEAVAGANVVATDTWASMGVDDLSAAELSVFEPFRATEQLLAEADSEAIVFHCLPAHRGQEITSELLDGPRSAAWDQAENRLHVQKALLTFLLEAAQA